MVHDALRGRTVVFSGYTPTRHPDTWEWNGARWIEYSPAASPSLRVGHAMAYDLARRRTVLFGGGDPNLSISLADTWLWDGSAWSRQLPANSPGPRSGHAMCYDVSRQRTVLFGGVDGATGLADTWEHDGTNWTLANPTQRQVGLASPTMDYDPLLGRVIRFGGAPYGSQTARGDLATWDGTTWTALVPSGPTVALAGHAMAYDWAHGHLLVFGGATGTGISADLWMLGALTPATATSFGTGCGGTAGLPVLTSSLPRLGAPAFVLDLVSARPTANCAFALASATQNLPIGGGCTLYLGGALVTLPVLSNAAGFASVDFPMPLDPRLLGGVCHAQAFVADPQAPVIGLACSAGRTLVVGD